MKRARYDHGGRLLAFHAASMLLAFEAPGNPEAFEMQGETAVVSIRGPLMQHGGPFAFWDDYDSIASRVAEAAKAKPRAIVMKIDSPGGDALGCFEATRSIRATCAEAEVPLYVYCDGMIASAAFALACAASSIFVPEAGVVGSIGIIKQRVDVTKADAAAGLAFEQFTSGQAKTYGNPHSQISDAERKSTQAEVDELAEVFFDLIGEMRGTRASREAIKALDGEILLGAKAVKAGLADGVLGWSDFLAMVASGGPSATSQATGTNMNRKEMKAALAEMAGGDGEDAKRARKALALFDEDDEKDDDKKDAKAEGADDDKKDDKDSAKAEDKKPDAKAAKAEEDGEKDKAKAEDEKDKAQARAGGTSSNVIDLAARVHALETEKAAKAEADERAKLLAGRPDFSKEVRATLENAELTSLRALKVACDTWPRARSKAQIAAGATTPNAARGEGQDGDPNDVDVADADTVAHIDRAMGLKPKATGPVRERNTMIMGAPPTREEAAKLLEASMKKTGGR